jgi:hypothetical protein
VGELLGREPGWQSGDSTGSGWPRPHAKRARSGGRRWRECPHERWLKWRQALARRDQRSTGVSRPPQRRRAQVGLAGPASAGRRRCGGS